MNKSDIEVPTIKGVDFPIITNSIPEISNIIYDLWTLKITLLFPDLKHPVYLIFKNLNGFRVLDEGNLLEFWNNNIRIPGWIWIIEKGGWFDLEKTRNGFVEGYHENEYRKEYLILGQNDCVSIISMNDDFEIINLNKE